MQNPLAYFEKGQIVGNCNKFYFTFSLDIQM